MSKIRVVGAVFDTRQLTLYKEDGETVIIPQGDGRLKNILELIKPVLLRNDTVELDITTIETNSYKAFEANSSGSVKLFHVAKTWVKNIFKSKEEKEAVNPVLDSSEASVLVPGAFGRIPDIDDTLNQIMENAVPVSSVSFAPDDENDTIVAVVDGKVIPGMEKLAGQFSHSTRYENTVGLENFLKRISKVIDERGHSIEDLLRFMEKGDMPLADDGSIIVYKVLSDNTHIPNKYPEGTFYDCHTRKVPQRVGSYVHVNLELVDTDRRNECSNGLHVARRDYLRNFSGQVCVMCKVAPEDVVTVPHNDPSKVRVMGYHIIGQIAPKDYEQLTQNKSMMNSKSAKKLLTQAIKGYHIGITEYVKINGPRGADIVITPANGKKASSLKSKISEAAVSIEDSSIEGPSIDPRKVAKEVTKTKTGPRMTNKEKAMAMFTAGQFQELIEFKRKVKLGWGKLGMDNNVRIIEEKAMLQRAAVKSAEARKALKKASPKPKAKPAPKKKSEKELTAAMPLGMTNREKARWFYKNNKWLTLIEHKRKVKVSWEKLGFVPSEILIIMKKTNNL